MERWTGVVGSTDGVVDSTDRVVEEWWAALME
jgi:hypothetical protein